MALFFGMCVLLTHSFETSKSGRSVKPSTAKSRRVPRLSRDLRFISKPTVSLAKPSDEFKFELGK